MVHQFQATGAKLAVLQLLCLLKKKFEPKFSQAIHAVARDYVTQRGGVVIHSQSSQAEDSKDENIAVQRAVRLHVENNMMDTLQICQVLRRWCLEQRPEIGRMFGLSEGRDDGEQSDRSRRREYLPLVLNKKDLFVLIHNLTDNILECRTLIAHNLLSVTPHECAAVTRAIEKMLSLLDRSGKSDDSFQAATEGTLCSEWRVDSPEGKIMITLELMYALESSVVSWVQSLQRRGTHLPLQVHCVSTLCSLLRNERWHEEIKVAVGVHPRPLVLKVISISIHQDDKPLSPVQTENLSLSPPSQLSAKQQEKKYSHLDMIYLARNTFNHSSFDALSAVLIAQWVSSCLVLIKFFNGSGNFNSQIYRLEKFRTILEGYTSGGSAVVELVEGSEEELVIAEREEQKDKPNCLSEESANDILQRYYQGNTDGQGGGGSRQLADPTRAAINTSDDLTNPPNHRPALKRSLSLVRILKGPPSRAFVGRQSMLDSLLRAFWGNTIHQEPTQRCELEPARVAILSGHPAIGKSYVALQAVKALESCSPFQVHFWVTATSSELLKAGLLTLINAVGQRSLDNKASMDEITAAVLEMFRQTSCLLVVDDVVDATLPHIQELVSSLSLRNFVLITTCLRAKALTKVEAVREEVGPLPIADCFELLKNVVLGKDLLKPLSNTAAASRVAVWKDIDEDQEHRMLVERIMTERLGRSPLGITLLGKFFSQELSFDKVLERFYEKDDFSSLNNGSSLMFAGRHSGLDLTVQNIVSRLQNKRRLLSILYAVSIMSPNGIPLRLLSHFRHEGGGTREKEEEGEPGLSVEELTELEQTGLLYSEPSVQATCTFSSSERGTYIYIHQLTQRSLRRVLSQEYGIVPKQIHRSIVRGFWADMQMDSRLTVSIDKPFFEGFEEAAKWSESVLSSVFSRQILSPSKCFAGKEESHPGEAEHSQVQLPFDRETVNGLLLASTVLVAIDPSALEHLLRKILLQVVQCSKALTVREGEAPPACEDRISGFLQGTAEVSDMEDLLLMCQSANVTLEYFLHVLITWAVELKRNPSVVSWVRVYHSLMQKSEEAGRRTEMDSADAKLGNVRALIHSSLACGLLLSFKLDEGHAEAELAMLKVKPGERYYELALWECTFAKASAFYYKLNMEDGITLLEPTHKAAREENFITEASKYEAQLARMLLHVRRFEDALKARESILQRHLSQYSNKFHMRVASSYHQVGQIYSKLRNFDAADYHYREHAAICRELGQPCDIHIVVFYHEWGKYTLAKSFAHEIYAQTGHRRNRTVLDRLNVFCCAVMTCLALGPSYAREVNDLYRQNPELIEICRSPETHPLYRIFLLLIWSRARSWIGDYQEAWMLALEADDKGFFTGDRSVLSDELYYNINSLFAPIHAMYRGLLPPVVAPLVALSGSSSGKRVSSLLDGTSSGDEVLEETPRAPLYARKEKFDQETCQEEEQKVEKWISRIPVALSFCIENVETLRTEIDKSWLYEYAWAALQLCGNTALAQRLLPTAPNSELLLAATKQSALETLQFIVSSDAEETEWTTLARDLLQDGS